MEADTTHHPTALAPLKGRVFRLLWLACLSANIALWMNEVAASWMMATLTENTLLVALVQTASTFPVFALGLASGAMADIVDRRRFFAATQILTAVVAVVLAIMSLAGLLSAPLLLLLVAANGVGMAMRLPVFAAIIPNVVSRTDLPSALALNGVAMNLSRIVGPLIAGALIASVGSHWVFLLNAVLSTLALVLILSWKSTPQVATLPGERFFAAMRVGMQHVGQSPRMQIILVRAFLFFFQSSALIALLPLFALQVYQGGSGTYTLLLASMGLGAVSCAFILPTLRRLVGRDDLILIGACLQAVSATVVGLFDSLYLAVPAMIISGAAWIGTANSLSTSAQLALPDWVRARGMSIYQMGIMGGMAGGAAAWGYVATLASLQTAVITAAVLGPLLMVISMRAGPRNSEEEDLTPYVLDINAPAPTMPIGKNEGPVVITIEYLVEPGDERAFLRTMRETRRSRLRQGALSWALFRDSAEPGRFVEYFMDGNWIEHLRRRGRFTAADAALMERRLSFHRGEAPPRVRRYVGT